MTKLKNEKPQSIEFLRPLKNRTPVRHALFGYEGTISTLREGWEKVMELMMTAAILGTAESEAADSDRKSVRPPVLAHLAESSGMQTILQMEHLVEMVRGFGFVAEKDIPSAAEYKITFDRLLMQHMAQRREAVASGTVGPDTFCICGARSFLHTLRERGVRLYLASGIDVEEVRYEASLLGFADLFDGGIFGATGEKRKYSKRMVIQQILHRNALSGPELICFGDGPAEIREAKNHRGVGCGVASDEIRRCGLNPIKRDRLVHAGADFIIPDFLDSGALLTHIFPG